MYKMINQYADKIKGQFTFFDQVIINGYSDPVDNGLICVLKTLEACRTAKVVGQEGKHFLKSSFTKCLHYYLYYLDKDFGFMFVKIQTWFPFKIQVCINGRELMKHVFDANGITYECYDN